MAKVYLGLGSNLGNKEQNLYMAVDMINERIGKVSSLSAFYMTAPWGFVSEHIFLNAACCLETRLLPLEVLVKTKEIENALGRKNKSVNGIYSDRLIDIDLLLYGDWIINTDELKLPHPLMTERDFVMKPLCEIAPELIHPVLKKSIKELFLANSK